MSTGPFGPRIGSYDVELAVVDVLKARLPTYIAYSARKYGVNPAQEDFPVRPTEVDVHKDFEGWPQHHLPHVRVVSPGMARQPARERGGAFTTWWEINVFTVVSARDLFSTRRLRAIYELAVPWCLTQYPSLGGISVGIEWLGESSGDVPIDPGDDRTLQGTVGIFVVQVEASLDPMLAPGAIFDAPDGPDPALHDYGPWPTVEQVHLNLEDLPE